MNKNNLIGKYFICCISIFFIGCNNSTEINFPLQYEGDKLIILSNFEANQEILVRILKTSPPLDTFFRDSFYVPNAIVKLLENDTMYMLRYIGNGFFETEGNIQARTGNSYKVEAIATGFPAAFSDWEIVPDSGIIEQIRWTAEPQNDYEGFLEFRIILPNELPFELSIFGIANGDVNSPIQEITEGIGLYCEGTVFIPECLTSQGNIKVLVDRDYFNGNESFIITHLIVSLRMLSISQKNYEESITLQEDAFDYPFIANSSPYTNIHNGYGLVSGSSEVQVTIAIN